MSLHTANLLAIYPGTFDPTTLGHVDLMRRAARLFPQVVVAVARGHHKRALFDVDERLAMAREAAAGLGNVRAEPFDGLLADHVRRIGAGVIIRGVRAVGDYDYEFQMAGMNRLLMPAVETVFLTPGQDFQYVSGTFVREIALLGGDVSHFVTPAVAARLQRKALESGRAG